MKFLIAFVAYFNQNTSAQSFGKQTICLTREYKMTASGRTWTRPPSPVTQNSWLQVNWKYPCLYWDLPVVYLLSNEKLATLLFPFDETNAQIFYEEKALQPRKLVYQWKPNSKINVIPGTRLPL